MKLQFFQNIIKISLFPIIFLASKLPAQALMDNNSLFEINNKAITKEEFIKRFEMSPRTTTGKSFDSVKVEFLYSLIAEKLWAEEAKEFPFQESDYFRLSFDYVKKMYVRDALYKKEVKDKIDVDQSELNEGIEKIRKMLSLRYINSKSETAAETIYEQLLKNISFDSLCFKSDGINTFCDTISITFGKMQKFIEDSVYNLRPGEFTKPINSGIGNLIFVLDSVSINFSIMQKTDREVESEVLTIVKNRKEDGLSNEYYRKFFAGQLVNVDIELFNRLAESIEMMFKNNNSDEIYYVNDKDVDFLLRSLSKDDLNSPYVKFKDQPVNMETFIKNFTNYRLAFRKKDINSIKNNLNQYNRDFIRNELLAREGLKQGLDRLPEVEGELNNWRDYFLANYYMHTYIDSAKISESEVYEYYAENMENQINLPEVKIAEINTKSLEEMETVLEKLKNSEFIDVMIEYPESNNGDSIIFKPISDYANLIQYITEMEINEIYGPFENSGGYSVIKLIDRKEKTEKVGDVFQKNKELLKEKLFYRKLGKIMNTKTVSLAKKYNLNINTELFNSINLTEVNMLVLRLMGFGGNITAVPLTKSFFIWKQMLKENTNYILP